MKSIFTHSGNSQVKQSRFPRILTTGLVGVTAASLLFSCNQQMNFQVEINGLQLSAQRLGASAAGPINQFVQPATLTGWQGALTPEPVRMSWMDLKKEDSETESEPTAAVGKEVAPVREAVSVSATKLSKREKQLRYIRRFGAVAKVEMDKFGIPASITLAQGLLESNVGESKLASQFNNHFGIKCFERSCRPGHCGNHSDDSHKDFFRKYHTAWESYRAHSEFLQKERYQALFKLSKRDYKAWAHGLKKAGYATDEKYAYKLIELIEDLRLYEFDK